MKTKEKYIILYKKDKGEKGNVKQRKISKAVSL
jgi:hypothetical protein